MGLVQVITSELGEPEGHQGQPFWRCPFHDDENASLTIYRRKGKELFKCFGCQTTGDGIDFLRLRHPEMTFSEAKGRLFSPTGGKETACQDAKMTTKSAGTWLAHGSNGAPPDWWKVVVRGSAARMFEPRYRHLDWLRARGLKDGTIRQAKLGVNEEGIVIPWFSPTGVLQAVNVRRFNRQPKYRLFEHSRKGILYPAVQLDYRKPVLLCEGEFDALLARQEADDLVQAVTLGSAGDKPRPAVLTHLALCRVVLVAFDGDESGNSGFRQLRRALPRAKRIRPPEGKDLTDLHRSLGLGKWLEDGVLPLLRRNE